MQVFRIDNSDVLSIFSLSRGDGDGGVRFSFRQLQAGLDELDRQARMAEPVDNASRSPFQRAVLELQEHIELLRAASSLACSPPTARTSLATFRRRPARRRARGI
jgi:hypothetical protein